MTKSYVRTATRSTLKVEANLTQILNFKANFHTEFEPFFKKKFMLTMVDTLRCLCQDAKMAAPAF